MAPSSSSQSYNYDSTQYVYTIESHTPIVIDHSWWHPLADLGKLVKSLVREHDYVYLTIFNYFSSSLTLTLSLLTMFFRNEIQAIFFSEFHHEAGPKIVYQVSSFFLSLILLLLLFTRLYAIIDSVMKRNALLFLPLSVSVHWLVCVGL